MKLKEIAIIGAGAAGLAAARHFSAHPDCLIKVFEKSKNIGGTWVYDQGIEVSDLSQLPSNEILQPLSKSSIYKNLRTNLPKEVMAFPDYPFPGGEGKSFLSHEEVQSYLEGYCRHYNLYNHIKFGKEVVSVEPVTESKQNGFVQWSVTVKDMESGEQDTNKFDSVLICNGHYEVPRIPEIQNLGNFKGIITHSRYYRKPGPFANKIVAVLGAGASGQDIAIDVASVAKKVYLCHRKKRLPTRLVDNITEKYGITGIEELSGDLMFQDGTKCKADVILFCTGYLYSMPFLSEKCLITLEHEGKVVSPLYKHLLNRHYPSMAFLGLLFTVCPFPCFHYQAQYTIGVQMQQVSLPSIDEMEADSQMELEEKLQAGLRPDQFHFMGDRQWKYMHEFADALHIPFPPFLEKLYSHVQGTRRHRLLEYREESFRVVEDGRDFEFDVKLS